MQLLVCEQYEQLSRRAAVLVQAQLTLKPDSVVGFATGSTPLGLYRLLAQAQRRGEMDASGITAVNLDEYYPLSPGHPQSYRTFMQHHVWRPLGLRPDKTHIPRGDAPDPQRECRRYDELLRAAMEELYLYHNRAALAGPHLEFTHMTTIWREHVYITSAPMEPEKDQVGKYVISFQSGRTLEVPLVYGVNIMNQAREWDRTRNAEWDCYEVDAALAEVTAATLPLLQPDGTTQFRFVVKNPWPDDPVVGVRTEKTCADAGWIYLTHFAVRQSFAASETVRACTDPSRRAKTPLI